MFTVGSRLTRSKAVFYPKSLPQRSEAKSTQSTGTRKQLQSLRSRKGAWSANSSTEEHCGLLVWEKQEAFSRDVDEQWFSACL